MNNLPIYLDANVPMYAVGGEHPYKLPCMWCMEQIAAGEMTAVINVEILQEILHRFMSIRRSKAGVDLCVEVADLSVHVYPVDEIDMRYALAVVRNSSSSIRARDCVHVATLYRYGIAHILTADRHFDNLPDITRLDPLTLYRDAGSPDIAVLFQ